MSFKIINAVSLYNGGGLTYIYFLKSYLDQKENILLLDYRIKSKLQFSKSKVFLIKRGVFRNLKIFFIRFFYHINNFLKFGKNINTFVEVYINGIPPLIRFPNSEVYIFCQNRLIFQKFIKLKYLNLSFFKPFLIIAINKLLFNLFIRPTDKIIVQTLSMKNLIKTSLKNKIFLQKDIWGDYDSKALKRIIKENKKNNNKKQDYFLNELKKNNLIFFYPACYFQHKNHENLIKAFNLLSDGNLKSHKLLLTFNENELNPNILSKNKNIIFIGHLNYFEILNIYKFVDYLIFPSLSESYGLPLLEAKSNNVKIIASNLPYVFDVCNPFIVFEPLIPEDISQKISSLLEK